MTSRSRSACLALTLTALDNTFTSFTFLVPVELTSTMLAVGLDAIKTGYQVFADVDSPQPEVSQDQDGNPIYGPAFCHSLWLEFSHKTNLASLEKAIRLATSLVQSLGDQLNTIVQNIGH